MKSQLLLIQILRGVAASLVVIHHILAELFTSYSLYNINIGFGRSGVDLFFVISGFVILYSQKKNKTKPVVFLIKRFFRVAPLYYFFTILAIIIFVSFNDYEETISHLIKSLLFIPSENSKGIIAPIYGLGWTLNYEFYFYLIFAVGLLFKRNMSLIVYLILISILIFSNIFFIDFYSNLICTEFIFGMICCELYMKGYIVKKPFLLFLFGLILFLIPLFLEFNLNYRFFYHGIPSAIILYSLVCFDYKKKFNNKNKIFNMLLKIGVSSYSLYLVHPFLIQAVFLIFPIEILEYNIFTTILVITISCILLGVITFNLIESNLTIVTKKLLNTIKYVKP